MNYIIYSSNVPIENLIEHNIFISPEARIEDNVKLFDGVKVYGESEILKDVELHSNTEISNSIICEGCKIYSSIISNSELGKRCVVKPFSSVNNCEIGENGIIGNCVVLNNSTIGANASVGHLSCIGHIEAGCNLNIQYAVCFDDFNKDENVTYIGDNVTIGANCNIISPVIISDNVEILPFSNINKDIEAGAKATSNIKQSVKLGK